MIFFHLALLQAGRTAAELASSQLAAKMTKVGIASFLGFSSCISPFLMIAPLASTVAASFPPNDDTPPKPTSAGDRRGSEDGGAAC